VSSSCFVSGFLISALGLYLRQYWMVVLGYGFVGGIGLGIGYISPVSTLIKWFPDRPGLSTGIAIMGFGGGALIASPLTNQLLSAFGGSGANPDPDGIAQTFLVMGLIYAVFMSVGWLLIRVPAPDWKPAGWDPAHAKTGTLITTANVSARSAIRTPQFWLLWVVLVLPRADAADEHEQGAVPAHRDPAALLLRRGVRHRSGLPARPVRDLSGRSHPRAPAYRLVDGRCARAGDRQRDRGRADRGRSRGPRGGTPRHSRSWSGCWSSGSSATS